jgi:hypothetical protein
MAEKVRRKLTPIGMIIMAACLLAALGLAFFIKGMLGMDGVIWSAVFGGIGGGVGAGVGVLVAQATGHNPPVVAE